MWKFYKLSLISLVYAGFLFIVSCGGGAGSGGTSNTSSNNGSSTQAIGSISAVSTSVPTALNSVFNQTSVSSAMRSNMEGEGHDQPPSQQPGDKPSQNPDQQHRDDFDNCTKTDNTDGSFSITCNCIANGTQQGTVVHQFNKSVTHGTCQNTDGSQGRTLKFDGSGTTTFNQCAVEKCGQTLTVNGEISETVTHSVNTCDHTTATTVNFKTADACSGMTITEGTTNTDLGLQVTITKNAGPKTIDGSICIDNQTTNFTSMDQLEKALDPAGVCQSTVQQTDE